MDAHEVRGRLTLAAVLLVAVAGCKGGNDRIRRNRDAAPVEEMTGDSTVKRRMGAMEREPNDKASEAGALPLDTVGRGRRRAR
jgi:hypothetical protein